MSLQHFGAPMSPSHPPGAPMGACRAPLLSAEGEAPGVDVHAGDTDVLERHGEQEGGLGWDGAEQIRVLLAALEAEGGVVQHLLVPVADLLHLQPVQLCPQAHQLLCQALVCSLQLLLWENGAVSSRQRLSASSAAGAAGLGDRPSGNQEYVVLGSAQSPCAAQANTGTATCSRKFAPMKLLLPAQSSRKG